MISSLTSHMSRNRWLWSGVLVVLAVLFWGLRAAFGTGYHFGDLMAFALMVVGALVILQSQEGYNPPRMEV